jgi:hypothetical protein
MRFVHFGGPIFQQAEEAFRWFVDLVRKPLDEFPDASVDRLEMKGGICCLNLREQF